MGDEEDDAPAAAPSLVPSDAEAAAAEGAMRSPRAVSRGWSVMVVVVAGVVLVLEEESACFYGFVCVCGVGFGWLI